MSCLAERLRTLRGELGLSQQKLSEATGLTKSSINMYERGEREPGLQTVATLAHYFKVDTDYLLGQSEYRSKAEWLQAAQGKQVPHLPKEVLSVAGKTFPLLGDIACGEPIFAEEEQNCFGEAGGDLRADFCLRAKGDSMIGARIMDGDLVFIRAQSTVENGEIAAVIIEDSATLKRVYYYPEEGKLSLNAENPRYAPLIYVGEELNHIRILGKAVAFQSKI
jgi:repressor LexA